jgi:motility quorum-sensing regulator / GCU-specific mRNA interferase toxin
LLRRYTPRNDLRRLFIPLCGIFAVNNLIKLGAQAMGLEIAQAIEVVCTMRYSDFFKSMTTHSSSRVWQDVYHPKTPVGVAYVTLWLKKAIC